MTHSADDSVSFGKMSRVRLRAWHILSNHRAVTLHDRCCKRRISQGIDSVNSRAKNSYRLPASFDSFPVCSRVNAIGEPADHTQTSFTKLLRPLLCLLQTVSARSEEHTSELQSRGHLVCRLLLETKNTPPPAEHRPNRDHPERPC